jgi:hypothetical protein
MRNHCTQGNSSSGKRFQPAWAVLFMARQMAFFGWLVGLRSGPSRGGSLLPSYQAARFANTAHVLRQSPADSCLRDKKIMHDNRTSGELNGLGNLADGKGAIEVSLIRLWIERIALMANRSGVSFDVWDAVAGLDRVKDVGVDRATALLGSPTKYDIRRMFLAPRLAYAPGHRQNP